MDMSKYTFYTGGNKVIAVSTYAGKIVKGYAKCDPRDEYDLELGKKLAAARCNAKVAKKRAKRAAKKLDTAYYNLYVAYEQCVNMTDYHTNSLAELEKAEAELEELLKGLN